MTLCAIYPPGTILKPMEHESGPLHLVEAWPGSVFTVDEVPDGEGTVPPQLVAFVLDFRGDLPPGRIGILFVLRPDEVARARALNTAATTEPREYARCPEAEWREVHGYGRTPEGPPPTTTCRMVEAWEGSIRVRLGLDGHCSDLFGVAHCMDGELPDRLLGLPLMLHLADCALRAGHPHCDCFEVDDDEGTGRRPR